MNCPDIPSLLLRPPRVEQAPFVCQCQSHSISSRVKGNHQSVARPLRVATSFWLKFQRQTESAKKLTVGETGTDLALSL